MSLLVLMVTAALQAVVVVMSGSVALLGDTIHNVADALTALPLGVAFLLGRRSATRCYTYGYGRAEDLAGLAVVLVIASSSVLAGYESLRRLAHPAHVSHLAFVAVAAVIGFAGNELVARYRITVGRRIGSAALVADGCTPAPTGSPRSPSSSEPPVSRSARGGPTQSSACSSPSRSCWYYVVRHGRSTGG
jgi:cation diffusion facilitator family transporter